MASERTLYLHIGLPKTASTWLQEMLFGRLDHLTVRSVPRSELFNAADDAEQGFRLFACVLLRSAAIWRRSGEAIFAELLDERAAKGGDLLISDEAIGRAASRPEVLSAHLAALADVASALGFARVRVLAVVRRQDTWLASHYAQVSDRTFAARQADFETVIARTLDPARERFGFGMLLDYAALHAALSRVVGADDVLLVPFERFRDTPAATLDEVLRWLKTPSSRIAAHVAAATPERANVRSQLGAHGLAWRLRPPAIAVPGGRRWRVPVWVWPRRRIVLTSELSSRVLSVYRHANEALADATGLDLAPYGYFPARAPSSTLARVNPPAARPAGTADEQPC